MKMSPAQLIQTQSPAPGQSVSVWKQAAESEFGPASYRKIWQSQPGPTAKAWLSWAHHEHLLLTLIAHGDSPHVVKVAGLQVQADRVEVVTVDAGLDFQRDWLEPLSTLKKSLFEREEEALKLARTSLKALQSIHAMGVVHGDFKSDNLCVPVATGHAGTTLRLALDQLRLIDFAYAVYKEQPLKFVLPTDPDRLTYLPDFFRQAIRQAQEKDDPAHIQDVACAQVDLYSLWYMMRSVVPATTQTADWSHWQNWMDACERAGSEPTRKEREFDAPTTRLLAMTEKALHELCVPKSQWDDAETVIKTLCATAKSTPLLSADQTALHTPLLGVQPTALPELVPTITVVADTATISTDLDPINDAAPVPGGSWLHHKWWLMASTLCGVFIWVDGHFVQTGLELTDLGFGLGLMAFALATPVLMGLVWHGVTRSTRALVWVKLPGVLLCGIAAYFLIALWGAGVPEAQLAALLVLIALLAVGFLSGLIFYKV
jgi:hypothetical protein